MSLILIEHLTSANQNVHFWLVAAHTLHFFYKAIESQDGPRGRPKNSISPAKFLNDFFSHLHLY